MAVDSTVWSGGTVINWLHGILVTSFDELLAMNLFKVWYVEPISCLCIIGLLEL